MVKYCFKLPGWSLCQLVHCMHLTKYAHNFVVPLSLHSWHFTACKSVQMIQNILVWISTPQYFVNIFSKPLVYFAGIYLVKRSMRNKQKHGLEEYEQVSAWSMTMFSYTLSCEYRVVRYRYSRLLFTSEDRICACKNNRRIWHHNASVLHSRDVTYQLWWRHNTKSEKIVLSDNGEINDR